MSDAVEMNYLYHYYEKSKGPFMNLSDLTLIQAQNVLDKLKRESDVMAAHRNDEYLERRYELEQIARNIFISKGGKPERKVPHYMIVGECDWLNTWYSEGESIKIHISKLKIEALSFSYGDLFPTFSPRVNDGREYRKQIYTYEEILKLIQKYDLPQNWNKDGLYGPERYIEVQVWDDEPINYVKENE
ncbi:MAG: hypothetical protein ACQEXX_18335 [Bacillota bacterium]